MCTNFKILHIYASFFRIHIVSQFPTTHNIDCAGWQFYCIIVIHESSGTTVFSIYTVNLPVLDLALFWIISRVLPTHFYKNVTNETKHTCSERAIIEVLKYVNNYCSWCRIDQIDNDLRRTVSFTLLVPPCFGLQRKRYFNVLHKKGDCKH